MKKSVEITGMSAVTPIGIGVTAFSEALKKGLSNFSVFDIELEEQCFQYPIAIAEGFDFKKLVNELPLPKAIIEQASRLRNMSKGVAFGVYSVLDAWANAQLSTVDFDPYNVAIVACGNNFQRGNQTKIQEKYRNKLKHLDVNYGLNFLDTDIIGIVSDLLNTKGEGYTIGAASASGNMGLIQGTRLIESGDYDIVIVVAPMMEMSIYEYVGFTEMSAMSSLKENVEVEKLCRPFDTEHSGFVFGENAGCIILESSEHQENRSIPSWGQIKGTGVVLDSNRNPNPSAQGEAEAMNKAILKAGITAADISYANLHGSASPLGDKIEVEAALSVGLEKAWANSTKSLIGHGIVAAGLVEAIACVIQLKEGFVHESKNLTNPITSDLKLARKKENCPDLKWALTNSYGFGGINTSIVIKKNEK